MTHKLSGSITCVQISLPDSQQKASYCKAVSAKSVAILPQAFGQSLGTSCQIESSKTVSKERKRLCHFLFHQERTAESSHLAIHFTRCAVQLEPHHKFVKTRSNKTELTGTFGRRPSRKLLIVPNSPSCQMGKASVRTFVRFRSSSCAAAASIWAHTASLSFCSENQSLLSEPPQTDTLQSPLS
jgi:hypothetical protein